MTLDEMLVIIEAKRQAITNTRVFDDDMDDIDACYALDLDSPDDINTKV